MKTFNILIVVLTLCLWWCKGSLFGQSIEKVFPEEEIGRLTEIDIEDNGVGYAAGTCQVLMVSKNGGELWEQKALPVDMVKMRKSLLILNATGGLLYVSGDEIFLSEDFGETWQKLQVDVDRSKMGNLKDMLLTSEENILILGDKGIMRSRDHGFHWEILHNPTGYDLVGMTSVPGFDKIWMFDDGKTLYLSEDEGENWTLISIMERLIFDVKFIDDSLGFAITSYSAFNQTKDGGKTWKEISTVNSAQRIIAFDSLSVFCYGNYFTGYMSNDGGVSWSPNPCFINQNIYPFYGMTKYEGKLYLASSGNSILYKLHDGYSWMPLSGVRLAQTLSGSTFAKGRLGFFSKSGTYYLSQDNGEHWKEKHFTGGVNDIEDLGNGELLIAADKLYRYDGQFLYDLFLGGGLYSKFYKIPNSEKVLLIKNINNGRILLSEDNGKSWKDTLLIRGSRLDYNGTYGFGSEVIALLLAPYSKISLDGAKTWQPFQDVVGVKFEPKYVKFVSAEQCLCMQKNKIVYWDLKEKKRFRSDVIIPKLFSVNDYLFINADVGFVIGWFHDERNNAFSGLSWTKDGGKTWSIYRDLCNIPYKLNYDPDNRSLFVATKGETIFRMDVSKIVANNSVIKQEIPRLKVFPNPASKSFHILGIPSQWLHGAKCSLTNSQGEFVWYSVLMNPDAGIVPPARLPAGVYFLHIDVQTPIGMKSVVCKVVWTP